LPRRTSCSSIHSGARWSISRSRDRLILPAI
jgi:hypothetical protein